MPSLSLVYDTKIVQFWKPHILFKSFSRNFYVAAICKVGGSSLVVQLDSREREKISLFFWLSRFYSIPLALR